LIKVGIIGATGYTGVELLRLLSQRDDVEIHVVTSRELAGQMVCSHFPNLRGHIELKFSGADSSLVKECDVVFFATPHAVAMHSVPSLIEAGVKIIDLSADFRIKNMLLKTSLGPWVIVETNVVVIRCIDKFLLQQT